MTQISFKKILMGGLSLSSLPLAAQIERPNIIFIMSDDHSVQAISSYNGELNNTPNIDRLAQKGARFTNCFCTNGISGPSRAAILTGTFSHINKHYNNYVEFDTSQINLPKVLRRNGYQTAIIGKWHLKTEPSGFNYWNILPGQGDYYNPDFINNGNKEHKDGYVTELITEDAINWLEDNKGDPFFLMIHHKAPHRNWMPPLHLLEKYEDENFEIPENYTFDYSQNEVLELQKMSIAKDMMLAYDLKILHPDSIESKKAKYMGLARMTDEERAIWISHYKKRFQKYQEIKNDSNALVIFKYQCYMQDYLACVEAIDQSVGEVRNFLKNEGLDKNTIVFYTSDQGFFLGEKGWFDKRFMYEESLRMPLIISYPGLETNDIREQMIMNIDFAPTILEMAGIEVPDLMQGESFLTQLKRPEAKGRENVYYHYFEFPGPHSVARHYGIRTKNFKLIHFYHGAERWEMYDLQKDSLEMNSVFGKAEYQEEQIRLLKLLEESRILYKDTIKTVPPDTRDIYTKASVVSQSYVNMPNKKYTGTGDNNLYDGKIENLSPLGSMGYNTWSGFLGDNLDLKWELIEETQTDSIKLRFLDSEGSWIFPPKQIQVNADGRRVDLDKIHISREKRFCGGTIITYAIPVFSTISKLQIFAENEGVCPVGHVGEGEKAWLFIEEIIID